ncbi:cytidine deaminase [Coralloluteibacterium thermophilus]|uniref:Cytidine deaminase n=1 Tax=Coralloluteibacterium thermophilum TaxID=2707049 RepID=A0ABV9NF13_9GAMM
MSETTAPADVRRALLAARGRAYAPYSGHPVGAVVIGDDGSRHAGCNVEVAHYKGICAEAGAIAAMMAAGVRGIRAVYVLGPGGVPCTPCGDCRQRIREFASPDTPIMTVDDGGRVLRRHDMQTLLPDAFGPENLAPASPLRAGAGG